MATTAVTIPRNSITEYCKKWRIKELSLFGSFIRPDFGPDSDIDVLVEFAADADWSLFDWVDMVDKSHACSTARSTSSPRKDCEIRSAGRRSCPGARLFMRPNSGGIH